MEGLRYADRSQTTSLRPVHAAGMINRDDHDRLGMPTRILGVTCLHPARSPARSVRPGSGAPPHPPDGRAGSGSPFILLGMGAASGVDAGLGRESP